MQTSTAAMIGCLALASACGAPAAPDGQRTATGFAPATAFQNDQLAYDYFRGQGFTTFQAAGIVGNLDQESGLDPNIAQSAGGPGRGIAQWSAGGRWDSDQGDNLVAFAAQEGKSPYDLGLQLDFIMFELQMFPDYGLAKLKASGNLTDATTDFELDFEGCAIASECDLSARINYAQDVLDAYGGDPVAGDGGAGDGGGAAGNGGGAAGMGGAAGNGGGPAGAGGGAAGAGGGTAGASGSMAAAPGGGGCSLVAMGGAGRVTDAAWLLLGLGIGIALATSRRRATARRRQAERVRSVRL